MGSIVTGECKNQQRKSYIVQKNYKHIKGGYGKLPLGNVYTCHGIFSRMCKFKKTNSETFLDKFIVGFVDGGLGFPEEPPINRIYET
jgi:hypothetical protein